MLIALVIVAIALIATPLFLVFGSAGMLLFATDNGTITSVAVDVFSEKFADSPQLVTVPLFTIAGYLLAESGTPRRLVELSRAWLGWMPGGLAVVCLGTSAFFTTFTGGSGITIVAIGGLLMPALIQERYPKSFSLGLVTSSGALGMLFPPAVPLILYGIVANILIDKLFLAGLIPGMLTVVALSVYSGIVGTKAKIPRYPFVLKTALKSLWFAKYEIALPIVLLGGLGMGWLRIHESSAFTALYVLVITTAVYKEISIKKDLPRIIRESMTLVGAILAILSTAIGFTAYMIQAQIPMRLLAVMETMITSKVMFLLVLNLFLLVVGMLMDIFAAIFVVVPLIIPIARHFGVDQYHLAITFLLNLEIGYLTPPVGLNLFISSFRFNKPVTEVVKATLPFMYIFLVSLVFVTYIPALSTYLPSLSSSKDLTQEELGQQPAETGGDTGGGGLDDLGGGLDDLSLDDMEVPAEDAGAAVEPAPGADQPAVDAPAPTLEPIAPAEAEPKPKKKKKKR
jgi:tripartite ATP-independent transporter DctM subunit